MSKHLIADGASVDNTNQSTIFKDENDEAQDRTPLLHHVAIWKYAYLTLVAKGGSFHTRQCVCVYILIYLKLRRSGFPYQNSHVPC